ncbi:hypothetical protein AOLI_G00064370 [Acnodon oligacanthus]
MPSPAPFWVLESTAMAAGLGGSEGGQDSRTSVAGDKARLADPGGEGRENYGSLLYCANTQACLMESKHLMHHCMSRNGWSVEKYWSSLRQSCQAGAGGWRNPRLSGEHVADSEREELD